MTTTYTYDASGSSVKPVDPIGMRTNMTYDPGPHQSIKPAPGEIEPEADEPTVILKSKPE